MVNENGWRENQKLVLADLERLQESLERFDAKSEARIERLSESLHARCNIIDTRCTAIEVKLAALQAVTKERARMWGFQGGSVPAGIAIAVYVIGTLLQRLGS